MKFQYPFQKLVDLKSNEKSQAEWMLSQAVGKLRAEELNLQELHSLKQHAHEELMTASQRTATVAEIMRIQGYMQHIDQKIAEKQRDVQNANIEVRLKRSRLNDKMIEEKIWQKAKENAFEHFKITMKKKEQDELDEIAVTRHANSVSFT